MKSHQKGLKSVNAKMMMSGVGVTMEPHENSNILDLIDSSNPNFDGRSRSMWGVFYDANFTSNLLCIT